LRRGQGRTATRAAFHRVAWCTAQKAVRLAQLADQCKKPHDRTRRPKGPQASPELRSLAQSNPMTYQRWYQISPGATKRSTTMRGTETTNTVEAGERPRVGSVDLAADLLDEHTVHGHELLVGALFNRYSLIDHDDAISGANS